MSGMTPLKEVCEILELTLGDEVEEFDTLSGWIVYRIDHIPGKEDHPIIAEQDYVFEVLSAEKGMVQSVHVTRKELLLTETICESYERQNNP